MDERRITFRRAMVAGAVTLALAIASGLAVVTWLRAQGVTTLVIDRLRAASGTQSVVDGAAWRWAWPPQIEIRGVHIANPAWAETDQLARIDRLRLTLDVVGSLTGSLAISDVSALGVELHVAHDRDAGWNLSSINMPGGSAESSPEVNLYDVTLVTRAAALHKPLKSRFEAIRVLAGGELSLTIGPGSDVGKLSAEIRYPAPAALLQGDSPSPLKATLSGSDSDRISFNGHVDAGERSLRGHLAVDVDDPAGFSSLYGLDLRGFPEVVFDGELSLQDAVWTLESVQRQVGGQSLQGHVSRDPGRRGEVIRAHLRAPRLRIRLGELCGHSQDAVSPQQIGAVLRELVPFSLQADLVVDRLECEPLPLGRVDGSFRSDRKSLDVRVDGFDLAGGQVVGAVRWRPSDGPGGRVELDMAVRRLSLAAFKSVLSAQERPFEGALSSSVSGQFQLSRPLATLDGDILAVTSDGRVSKPLIERLSLDLGSLTVERGPAQTEVLCAAMGMRFRQGVGTLRSFLMKTPEALVAAKGSVDLGKRELALRLQADSDQAPFFDLSTPVRIEGSFTTPRIEIDEGAAIAEAGAKALIAVLGAPLSGLAAILDDEEPEGQRRPCRDVLDSAR